MIVPMTKAYVVTQAHRVAETLESLSKVGVLHVENHGAASSDRLEEYQHLLETLQRATQIANSKRFTPEKGSSQGGDPYGEASEVSTSELEKLAGEGVQRDIALGELIVSLAEQLDRVEKSQRDLEILRKELAPWGKFSLAELEELREERVFLRPVAWQGSHTPDVQLSPEGATAKSASTEATGLESTSFTKLCPLFSDRGFTYGILITRREVELPATLQEVKLTKDLATVERELEELLTEEQALQSRLVHLCKEKALLQNAIAETEDNLHFEEARCAMKETGDYVVYLQGYLPTEGVENLRKLAKKEAFGLILDEPSLEDRVPTKLKFNRFSQLMKPLYGILGIVPGYRELDISTLFLIFFAIFVGLLIGDAGYGILLGAGALFLWKKSKGVNPSVLLLGLLSLVITLWGVVTGNWFGVESLASVPFIKALTIPKIAAFPEIFGLESTSSQDTIIYISFFLGCLQLSIANGINIYRERKSLRRFAHVGWGVFTISMYRLALNLILGIPFPQWGLYGLIAGAFLVFLFGAQKDGESFLYGVKEGAKGGFFQFLDMVGVFSNIVSYIRLFAVGLSSVAIAMSFNSLSGMLMGSPVGAILGVVIIVFGHSLNFAMGLLSMLVHGARLNLLEFSGQLNIEWSGIPYKPLEKQYKE